MLQIETRYGSFNKHEKIRIEQWVIHPSFQAKKLCQVTANVVWKKNRNLYAMLLLDMVLRERLDSPFAQIPPEGSIPVLSFHQVVSYTLRPRNQSFLGNLWSLRETKSPLLQISTPKSKNYRKFRRNIEVQTSHQS